MSGDLRTWFHLERAPYESIESFVCEKLFESGAWSSPRQSDGIVHVRIVESASTRIVVAGRIFEIDQSKHAFWLELELLPHNQLEWRLSWLPARSDVGRVPASLLVRRWPLRLRLGRR